MAKENMKWLYGNVYLVRTQAGFNQALYHHHCGNYEKSEIRKAIMNYPVSYPSLISIESEMFECRRIYVDVRKIGKIKIKLIEIFCKG